MEAQTLENIRCYTYQEHIFKISWLAIIVWDFRRNTIYLMEIPLCVVNFLYLV